MPEDTSKPAPLVRVGVVRHPDKVHPYLVLLTVKCPNCGKEHTHGGGSDLSVESVRRYSAARFAACHRNAIRVSGAYYVEDTYALLPLRGNVRSKRKPKKGEKR